MVAYHVTSKKKLLKYIQQNAILPPVRVWKSIAEAERFSKQTGRRFIIRLKLNPTFIELEGHNNMALKSNQPYIINNF